jgi:alginate O-acetyltransferase complex protein AlgI
MLDLIPLPIIWLLLFLLGRLADGRSIVFRRALIIGASSVLLFGLTGLKTWAFYTGIGVTIVLLGVLIGQLNGGGLRRWVFAGSLIATVLMILVYLRFRPYFPKYFPALPSLSYLGFRAIAYLVTAYRGGAAGASAGLLQMLFFPVLALGPITRVENYEQTYSAPREVLKRMLMGFTMLIAAHYLSPLEVARPSAATGLHWSRFWISAMAISFEFYFAFAGYSHLIISLGILAGFKLPENFNNPYVANSIRDFWRRWHMSLSFWIRDYVYIPLGGNRKGLSRKCANLMVAMGLCGIWHGLELHYLVWGLFHGSLLAGESVLEAYQIQPLKRLAPVAAGPIRIMLTFGLVTFSWMLFKYSSLSDTAIHVRAMLPW